MREIKFRVWNKYKSMMEYDVHLGDTLGSTFADVIHSGIPLMQYTGLKDKNGREIYEGDIVTGRFSHYDPCLDDHVDDESMGGVVYWCYGGWSFKAVQHLCEKDREGMVNYFGFMEEGVYWAPKEFGDMEVIGNIYENPELLDPKA